MKLAFSTNAFVRQSLTHALKAIAAAGFHAVEILADTPHWNPALYDRGEAVALRGDLDRLGLQVSNINANCTFGYWKDAPPEAFFEPSLISPNPQHRADRIQMIQNTLHFAKTLGAENISITSGKLLPTMPPDIASKQLRESLLPILETAEKLKIRVGLECEPGLWIEYASELRELLDRLGSRMLGANLDISHCVVLGEEVGSVLKLLTGRIWNCHVADLPGRKHYHLIPGTGTMDWSGLKAGLESIGYDRHITVELYTYPDQPEHAAQESHAFLSRVFN